MSISCMSSRSPMHADPIRLCCFSFDAPPPAPEEVALLNEFPPGREMDEVDKIWCPCSVRRKITEVDHLLLLRNLASERLDDDLAEELFHGFVGDEEEVSDVEDVDADIEDVEALPQHVLGLPYPPSE